MKKIDFILMFLLFLFGIFPRWFHYVPNGEDFVESLFYLKIGVRGVDVVMLFMLALTIYRYITNKYQNYSRIGIAVFVLVFSIWLIFEIIRNFGKFGLSAPGEFRFRYLSLVIPLYISMNFNSFESRKQLSKFLIMIGYFLPLLFIPIIGNLKGWKFGAENRFFHSYIHLGILYSLLLIFLSNKYNYIKFNKLILKFSLIPLAFFFIVDGHRSAWMAALIMFGLILYFKQLNIRESFRMIITVLIIIIFLIPSIAKTEIVSIEYIKQRASAFINPEQDPTSNWRLLMWKAQFERFISSPLTGVGFGNYWRVYIPNLGYVDISPHNYYVQTLVKLGLIGLIIYLIIVFKIFNRLKESFRNTKIKFNTEQPLIIFGLCVIITMHFYYFVYALDYYSLMYLGLALAVLRDKKYYGNAL